MLVNNIIEIKVFWFFFGLKIVYKMSFDSYIYIQYNNYCGIILFVEMKIFNNLYMLRKFLNNNKIFFI